MGASLFLLHSGLYDMQIKKARLLEGLCIVVAIPPQIFFKNIFSSLLIVKLSAISFLDLQSLSVLCLGPRSTRSCGGLQRLQGTANEFNFWKIFRNFRR